MSFLVRKIAISKWDVEDVASPVNADAITNCMKTSNNTLSVWRVGSPNDVKDGLLAIAASLEHLAKLDFVVLDEEALLERGVSIVATPGKTACDDLVGSHRDLANLNIKSLEVVSELIAEQIRANQAGRYTMKKVKDLLEEAVREGRLDVAKLKEDVRVKLSVA